MRHRKKETPLGGQADNGVTKSRLSTDDFLALATEYALSIELTDEEILGLGLAEPWEIHGLNLWGLYEDLRTPDDYFVAMRVAPDRVAVLIAVETARRRCASFRRFLALVVGEPVAARAGQSGSAI